MRKWLALLTLALLFHAGCARAEEIYYTNNKDAYYHIDPDCDRPEPSDWDVEAGTEFYDRECYRKYPISEEAALAFEKKACPVCVTRFAPVYLGEHMMDWEYDFAPWEMGDRMRVWGQEPIGSKEYRAEVADTLKRFETYYEESYDRKTNTSVRKHPYPDAYAGLWVNNSDGYSYAIVDPTQELLDRFKELFGGGAWIVPAKYGYNEISALQNPIFEMVDAWREGHPEFDIIVASSAVGINCLEVGIYGDTWAEAMPVLDAKLDFPIWVRFERVREMATAF